MGILWRLLAFLRPLWGWVVLSVLLGAGAVASVIGLLGTSAYLIATASLQPSIAVLQVAIVGVRFFGLSRGVLRYLERLASHSVNLRLLAEMRTWFYRALEPLAPAVLQSYRSGDILARIVQDIENLEHFYVRVVAPPLVAVIITAGVCWLVSLAHPVFSAILALGLLLGGLPLPWITHLASRNAGKKLVEARARLSAALVDGLQGSADLAAYRQERRYLASFEGLSQAANRAQVRLAWYGALANALNLLLSNLTLLAVLVAGILLAERGLLDGVTLAVLALVTLASFEAVQPLGASAQHLETSLQSGKRLFQLAAQKPAVHDPGYNAALPVDYRLELREVSFRYSPDSEWILKDARLKIEAGQKVALVGASGSGKSTLMHLLVRFWEVESGEILLGGVNLRALTGETVRETISLMQQHTFLFSTTLRQNLLMANPQASEDRLRQVLAEVRLDAWVQRLPQGLDTWMGEQSLKMSGGERQRLAIARVLLRASPVVLLDEPTSHLDAVTANEMRTTLLEAFEGETVIWITHQHDQLDGFDRVVEIEGGKFVEHDRLPAQV